jgi:hypothetical protein
MALDGWYGQVKSTDTLLNKLSDEQLMQEVSPRRNRGIYLLGHLAAVHDMMLPLLRFEESMYPALRSVFIDSPDRAVADLPPISELRAHWTTVNEKLSAHFASLSPDEWFTRHASISQEDFEKEPHRNRLNVVLVRTIHLSSHRGQLAFLAPKG